MSELTYGSFNEVRYAQRERNDCVVCAIAVATQTPYLEVHALLKSLGRRDRGRTPWHIMFKAVDQLGYLLEDITHHVPARTVATAPRELIHGSYIVLTRGHALAVRAGKVEDWSVGSRRRINHVYRATPTEKQA